MPPCSKLLDCKWDIVESDCPRMFVVIGDATAVGRNSELLALGVPPPNDGIENPELNVDDRELSKLVDESCDDDEVVDISNRDGASKFVGAGAENNAGNFAVKFDGATAGNETGAFIPKSSALAYEIKLLENVALLANPHNNRTK
jgi:hypothetical protein